MTRPLSLATALALALMCSANAVAQQPDQLRQWQQAPDGRADRLNTAKERLKLTPEQEQLWGRVDAALRKLQERAPAARSGEGIAGDDMERLRRRADLATQRAEVLRQLADAVQPLWGMLSEEQKHELSDLVRFAGRADERERLARSDPDDGRWADRDRYDRGMMHREGRGDYGRWHREHHDRMMRRYDDDAPDRRRSWRGWRDDDRMERRGEDRYGGWHDRFDPWIMRRERRWNDGDRWDRGRWNDDRRFGEERREWRGEGGYGMGRDRFDGHAGRDWDDRPDRGRDSFDRRRDRFDDEER